MEQIIETISTYQLEALIIGVLINILTGLIKIPIKVLAKKTSDYTKITRFIVFLPIVLGLALSFCYEYFIRKSFVFNMDFATLWLNASSFSLMLYAIYEKVFPSKKRIVEQSEVEESKEVIENVKEFIGTILLEEKDTDQVEEVKKQENKIILRGKDVKDVTAKK